MSSSIVAPKCVAVVLTPLVIVASIAFASASVPTMAECLEGSDFIANAAIARDHGMSRDAFMGRLDEDLTLIHAFPSELRWFAKDDDDEHFLRDEARAVFDAPGTADDHRAAFLRACFRRLST